MTRKFIILDESGYISGSDESDLEYSDVPANWIEVDINFQFPQFPINVRTKHVWKYHFSRKAWEKTNMLRTPAPGEILLDDDILDMLPETMYFV